jgi:hypothetical protein
VGGYWLPFSNCGNITLTNIVITDNVFTTMSNFVAALAPGQSATYSNAFTVQCVGNTTPSPLALPAPAART